MLLEHAPPSGGHAKKNAMGRELAKQLFECSCYCLNHAPTGGGGGGTRALAGGVDQITAAIDQETDSAKMHCQPEEAARPVGERTLCFQWLVGEEWAMYIG
jgi:hypothetical protein